MTQFIFSPNSKMADVIHANYNNLLVFNRLGIKLGFGDKTVDEVCSKNEVNSNLFILICSIFTNHDFEPNNNTVIDCPIDQVVNFLKKSHSFYRTVRLPEIKIALFNLSKSCEATQQKALERFYEEYSSEIEKHLLYEDQHVFPYIEFLIANRDKNGYSIQIFEDNHDDVEMKLTDLKNIIIKYLPEGPNDDLRRQLLEKLFVFEEDLNRHILIEDKILVPIVLELEKEAK